jgi:RNA polymerase sigma factor (sigma-70 family)
MTEEEFNLWQRYEAARKELISFYLPFVETIAKRIARSLRWANWEDLYHEGVIGLMKAVARYDPDQGVPFKAFAKDYIRGAIFDSSELTRDLARRQQEIYHSIKQAEERLTKTLQRIPRVEEVMEETGLTEEQILNALDAVGVAFARELSYTEDSTPASSIQSAQQERTAIIDNALSHLSDKEKEVISLYFWRDRQDKDIAREIGQSLGSVTKIRQRAIEKLRGVLGVEKKGGHNDE